MSISQLCTSVPLSTSCTDFMVNSKIFGEPRVLPPVLFMIEALNKAFLCRLFSVSCKQDASDYEQNTPEYTYQRNETVFSPENWTDFLFQGLPEDIQSKIVYTYGVINEYSLRSRDVHSTPSWHKWSDFEYRPWCFAIVVRTPHENRRALSIYSKFPEFSVRR